MSEDVYAVPDLTKKVRHGRGEREQEMEERGEREERIVDIYVTADNLGVTRDPGTQQDAVQNNTAQEQNGGSDQSMKNGSKAAAVCLVLLCLLLAVIVGLVVKYSELNKDKNNLAKNLDQIQSSFDQLQSNYNNVTAERDYWKRRLYESQGFTCDGCVCYHISPSTERKTWEDSRQYCRDRQSDLMVVKSKEKEDFVERVAVNKENMWLGLTDRVEEGVWKWVDGTPLITPTYWQKGEPKNSHNDDCAVFWKGDLNGWYVKSCDATHRWICESVMC